MSKLTREEAHQKLTAALQETRAKAAGHAFPLADSIEQQLLYLLQALDNPQHRARLNEILLGRYAAYEFEASDPAYADVLHEASAVHQQLQKGRL